MDLILYGAGGFAREVAWLAERCGHAAVAFIDDRAAEQGKLLTGLPVLSLDEALRRFPKAHGCVAVAAPAGREALVARMAARGVPFATLVHPNVERGGRVAIGEGSVVCAGTILTVDVRIGRHVHLNLDCTVGHDAVLDDFVTLAPGVHVSGNVHLERLVNIGTGANLINGSREKPLRVGTGASIGAGACVVRDIPAGATAVGVPAKPLAK
jgi:sugar O-acyltransferase (sialic acid O-acetyltransferase NeuD family)